MQRRNFLIGSSAFWLAPLTAFGVAKNGTRLAEAARAQIGVTTGYDPTWTRLAYPNGDVPRSTGVCADVVIRAARDAFGLDLQKLVHEDMMRDFSAYPARRIWGSRVPDPNIDHRRVLNLQAFWQRAGACLWTASGSVPGDTFHPDLAIGDIVTWLLDARLPHVGIVAAVSPQTTVVHNIGNGVEETDLLAFHAHRAAGHYRWRAA
jgi:uncharacterized protein YijF (DUF1287 family)